MIGIFPPRIIFKTMNDYLIVAGILGFTWFIVYITTKPIIQEDFNRVAEEWHEPIPEVDSDTDDSYYSDDAYELDEDLVKLLQDENEEVQIQERIDQRLNERLNIATRMSLDELASLDLAVWSEAPLRIRCRELLEQVAKEEYDPKLHASVISLGFILSSLARYGRQRSVQWEDLEEEYAKIAKLLLSKGADNRLFT